MKVSRDVSLRAEMMEISSEEQEKYNLYLQLCKYYKIDPNPLATSAWQAKNEILTRLLGGKKT